MIASLPDPQSAARWCAAQRAQGFDIGYVPTMGALHRGHLSLLARARRENARCCASIFINPLQFNNRDDLRDYPRDPARDLEMLESVGCDMVYGGNLAQFFPEAGDLSNIALPSAGLSAHGLEGEFRPGHLQGVCAIVERLFRTVGACSAYFGEKDFQQCLVVAELARRLGDVNVVLCPTVRDENGLALSSRNQRLTAAQLRRATALYQALCAAQHAWRDGERNIAQLERLMYAPLTAAQVRVEYATVRDAANWESQGALQQPRALIAGYVDEVRLIDNLALDDA